jgi:hypothetical protein
MGSFGLAFNAFGPGLDFEGAEMKIKRYDITPDLLKMFFSGERFDIQATENALPADAELVRITVNEHKSTPRTISLFYTSASFPDLPEGTILESEKILFTRHENFIHEQKVGG